MGARRRGREAALQILFSVDLAGDKVDLAVRDHFAFLASSMEGRDFAQLLVRGVADNAAAVDDMIRKEAFEATCSGPVGRQ